MKKLAANLEFALLALIISCCTITVGTRSPETAETAASAVHVVRRGENLFRIASYYYRAATDEEANRGVERIRAANALSGSALSIGQRLTIPGSSRPQPLFALTPPPPDGADTRTQTTIDRRPPVPPRTETAPVQPPRDPTPITRTGMFDWLVVGRIICAYGELGNKGIDILTPAGRSVAAAREGRVTFTGRTTKYGETVVIEHDNGYFTVYGHDISVKVRKDQAVRRGEPIAEVPGGSQKLRYLHFEIRRGSAPQDPTLFLPEIKPGDIPRD